LKKHIACWAPVLAALVLTASAPDLRAQGTTTAIDRVEEDWILVIASPDALAEGPQITTSMYPVSGDTSAFVAFKLNHRHAPAFIAGGLQIQAWDDDKVVKSESQGSALCDTTDEQITWTQRITLSGGAVDYSIENGQSTTWGKFGQGNGLLKVSLNSTAETLASYDPAVSVQRSGVGWQQNRVSRLKLLAVRYYSGSELVSTDSQPRTVVDNTGN
jgi:hypothetical protein